MTIDEVARSFTELNEDRPGRFEEMAAAVFAFQRAHNPVYARYCKSIHLQGERHSGTRLVAAAPQRKDAEPAGSAWPFAFLPVQAFKHAAVTSFPPAEAEAVFESSGTGRGPASRHFVKDLSLYERSIRAQFERVFGAGPFIIASHLPGYAERGERSSLLYMMEHIMDRYGREGSASFVDGADVLRRCARRAVEFNTPLLVFGAAFGLLDLVERERFKLPERTLVVETGGMKTHRRETDRHELHARLADGFGLERDRIRSEYGMCELLSQCYTTGDELFHPPPWVRFTILDPEDPLRALPEGAPGALGVVDLANIYTVSAILTEDRAVRRGDGFEVLGRLSGAELRGCNFLLEHV